MNFLDDLRFPKILGEARHKIRFRPPRAPEMMVISLDMQMLQSRERQLTEGKRLSTENSGSHIDHRNQLLVPVADGLRKIPNIRRTEECKLVFRVVNGSSFCVDLAASESNSEVRNLSGIALYLVHSRPHGSAAASDATAAVLRLPGSNGNWVISNHDVLINVDTNFGWQSKKEVESVPPLRTTRVYTLVSSKALASIFSKGTSDPSFAACWQ